MAKASDAEGKFQTGKNGEEVVIPTVVKASDAEGKPNRKGWKGGGHTNSR